MESFHILCSFGCCLSDRLNGGDGLSAKFIDEPLLIKENIIQIQNTLNLYGYDTGTPDGNVGP